MRDVVAAGRAPHGARGLKSATAAVAAAEGGVAPRTGRVD